MRIAPTLASALLMLALAGCGRPARLPDPATIPDPAIAARVIVLEGDTYVIDGRHFLLAGAVSPQSIPGARCWSEALASKFAIQRVKALFAEGRTLEIKPTGVVDGFNRATAHVILNGQDMAQTLYDEGVVARPSDGAFNWCLPISEERDGAPIYTAMFENGRR